MPVVVRRLREPERLGGYLIPANTVVAPSVYLMHRREDVYPDAGSFLPERFCRAGDGHLHVDPVRRRRASLPGRELCACRR